MIFQRGWIHCDPHAGNVLVRRKEGAEQDRRKKGVVEIVLLDHGLYTVITDNTLNLATFSHKPYTVMHITLYA